MADMSFEEVVRELGVTEEELKQMIADNEIRAFHEGGKLTFKREDVLKLKNRRETEPTLILDDTDAESILQEPILEEPTLEEPVLEEPVLGEALGEEPLPEEAPQPQEAPSAAEGTEETVLGVESLLEEEEGEIPLEVPGAEDTSRVGEETVGEDTVLDSGLLEEEDVGLALEDTEEEALLGEEVREAPRRVRPVQQEANPVMTALAVVTCVLLILPGAVLVNLAGGNHGVFPQWISDNLAFLNSLIDTIINLF